MEIADLGKEILQKVLGFLETPGTIDVESKNGCTRFNIVVEDAGFLIGRDGENLKALQHIFNLLVSKKTEYSLSSGGVIVDVNSYYKEKESYLEALAKNTAQRVLETKKEEELSPMSPMERRIIHLTVENIGGVKSESVGEGENRRVVIKPAEFKVPGF